VLFRIKWLPTYHKIWVELVGNGHDHLLKCEHVISISHALRWPWNVNIAVQVSAMNPGCFKGSCTIQVQLLSHSETCRLPGQKGKTCRPCGRGWKYREYWDHCRKLLDIHSLLTFSEEIAIYYVETYTVMDVPIGKSIKQFNFAFR
jgi:hypothetical protein